MKKTYLQLAREIATLQAAAEKQFAAEKKEAVAGLNEIIVKYALSAADLKFPDTGPSVAKPGPKGKSTSMSAVSGARYADGIGNTWGGRGPPPAWLRNAIAAGKSLESVTASIAPAAQPAVTTAAASAARVPRKKAGFTVAPKYRHPGSGDTWSGRGSAPRWLKEALRKRGAKLDDFLIAKPAATVSAGKPAKAAESGAATERKVAGSARSPAKPVASAQATPVKPPAVKKALASKALPKKASAAKKAVIKKSTQALTPAPVVTSTKTPAAKKQTAAAPPPRVATKATATSSKPARKAVTAKKKPAPSASAGVPSTAAPSVSASETKAASSVL